MGKASSQVPTPLLPRQILRGCTAILADTSQLQAKATSYLAQAGSIAQGWLGKLRVPAVQEKLRDAYHKGSAAVVTYTGILADQVYHWWCGEQ
uniref:Apolipoprotein C-II n=1 Tax=Apteryx owenii TaxID=8824 RepID=A0A8B9PET3_APTOW